MAPNFASPALWPTPEEVLEFEDPKFGRVRLELWSALRFRVNQEIGDLAVVRSQIRLEKDRAARAALGWGSQRHDRTDDPGSRL